MADMSAYLQEIAPLFANLGGKSPQELMAQKVRAQQALQGANDQAHSLDLLNFAAAGSNNDALTKATSSLAGARASQYKPVAMGNTGFAIPGTGEFAENPAYTEEKQMSHFTALQNALIQAQARGDAAQTAADARRDAAAMMGGLSQTRIEMAKQRLEMAKAQQEQHNQQQLDNRVTKFSGALESAGIPELDAALKIAEGRLAAHNEGELPGFGRGESWIPSAMAPTEWQQSRQDLQAAANIMLKARSGAAVTDPEMRRFLIELGSGKGMSEDTLRSGFANLRKFFNEKKNNIIGGVSPEVLDAFNERTGMNYTHAGKKPTAAPVLPTQDAISAELARRLKSSAAQPTP